MSVMLYPCMLCVPLLMSLFVLCVACLTVFVNCLVIVNYPYPKLSLLVVLCGHQCTSTREWSVRSHLW